MLQIIFISLVISALFSSYSIAFEQTTIQFADRNIRVELAISDEDKRLGLMARSSLPPNSGMLFVYPEPQKLSFWMKDTLIALDILFFSSDGVLLEFVQNAQPCRRQSPCDTYKNSQASQFVLELPAGTVKRWKIRTGMVFEFIQ